jgi:amino acid permease
MSNMGEKEKHSSMIFNAAPSMENCTDHGQPVVAETEEIKRDLASRHINMIAIAGMIVSPSSRRYGIEERDVLLI